jgi:hypothetical protein
MKLFLCQRVYRSALLLQWPAPECKVARLQAPQYPSRSQAGYLLPFKPSTVDEKL